MMQKETSEDCAYILELEGAVRKLVIQIFVLSQSLIEVKIQNFHCSLQVSQFFLG